MGAWFKFGFVLADQFKYSFMLAGQYAGEAQAASLVQLGGNRLGFGPWAGPSAFLGD